MHDIKQVRKDPEVFLKKIANRNVKIDLDKILKLD